MPRQVFRADTPAEALEMQRRHRAQFEQMHRRAALKSANQTLRLVVKDSPRDQGEYALAWAVAVLSDEVQLLNDAPHAGVIENGARPFTPPIGPLIEWARRRAGDLALGGALKIGPQAFRVSKAGNLTYRGQASLDPDDEQEIESFAYAVRQKIARDGLEPKYVMRNRLKFARESLRKAFEQELRKGFT